MTAYFVTRHPGALEWAQKQGIAAEPVSHLDPAIIKPLDLVLGTLPVHVAGEICTRGGRYFHLTMSIPEEARGRELSSEEMERFGAKLEEFKICRA